MNVLTAKSQGVLPLPDQLTGKTLVLHADRLGKRWQRAKFQLVKAHGGFGCYPDKIGSKVYVEFIADGDESEYRRGDFIGEASAELIAEALADPEGELPLDPNDLCYLAIGRGTWGKGDTIEEAKKQCRKAGSVATVVYRCHRETQCDGFSIHWPAASPAAEEVWTKKK